MLKHLLAALIICVPVATVSAQPKLSSDEREVRAVVAKLADTVHDQTAAARDALFADDAQIINAFGNRAQGRKQIDDFWNSMFSTRMFRTATNQEKSLDVRFLSKSFALVDRFYIFSGQRTPTSGRELPPRNIHMTLVLRKNAGTWRIIYYSVADLRSLERERASQPPR